jgi:type IV secretory pathway VirB9-like protein
MNSRSAHSKETVMKPILETSNRSAIAAACLTLALIGHANGQNTAFDKAFQEQTQGNGAPARSSTPLAPASAPAPAPAATPEPIAPGPAAASGASRKAPAAPRYAARAANQAYSGEIPLSCRTINWKKGDIIRLQAQPYKQIHVALPENGIDVIMGDKELWALDWINNRIFLKPTSRSSEGRSTTISAIGQSGNAYEFVVNRVAENLEVAHCVYIVGEAGLISRAAWAKPTEGEQQVATTLGREIATLREQNTNLQRQTSEGFKTYRKNLNSNYDWSGGGTFSRWNGAEVESVYDDGRFTYVRLKSDAQGLVSVSAEIDGKSQLLEYAYDAPSRTYQISGLFPKFVLRAGEQALTISRKAG